MRSNPFDDYQAVEKIVRDVLQQKGLLEPRHYTMTLAIVSGIFLQYPSWLIGRGQTHEAIMDDITRQMGYVADAVAVLDQATPIGAKMDAAMN